MGGEAALPSTATTTEPGPPEEFSAWYRSAHPGVVEAVLRAIRAPALATDAVDEAFARAFAGWDRVQAMRSPAGWVYRVAVNEARRQLRRATREEALLAAQPPPRPSPPPGGEAWLLVETLPVRQRAAVVLRHVAGLTEAQVGEALGVARSTISSSLADAYRNLGAQLATDADDRALTVTDEPVDLVLAVARSCGPDGCEVEPLGGGGLRTAGYSDAIRDRIRVRPGDLVAIEGSGPTIAWRWWSGTVEATPDDGTNPNDGTIPNDGKIRVSRPVTRPAPGDAGRASFAVELPADLAGVDVGETVWFGTEEGRHVVVAVAGHEAETRASARFPAIRQAIG